MRGIWREGVIAGCSVEVEQIDAEVQTVSEPSRLNQSWSVRVNSDRKLGANMWLSKPLIKLSYSCGSSGIGMRPRSSLIASLAVVIIEGPTDPLPGICVTAKPGR